MIITPSAPSFSARRLRRTTSRVSSAPVPISTGHAPRRLADDDLRHQRLLVIVEGQEFAGRAERDQPMDALRDLPIDEGAQRRDIDAAGLA